MSIAAVSEALIAYPLLQSCLAFYFYFLHLFIVLFFFPSPHLSTFRLEWPQFLGLDIPVASITPMTPKLHPDALALGPLAFWARSYIISVL